MYKKIMKSLIFVGLLLIIFSGCGEKESTRGPETLTSATVVSDAKVSEEPTQSQPAKLFLYNVAEKKSSVLLNLKSNNFGLCWSEDSKHCFILERGAENTSLYIFNVKDEKLEENAFNKPLNFISGGWIDNENIMLGTSGETITSYKFNIKDKWLELMSNDTVPYYESKIDERQKEKTDLLRIESEPNLGEKYSEGRYSKDKKKFLYNSTKGDTYIFNTETGIKNYLFNGFGLEWSPNETKIRYFVPKKQYNNVSPKRFVDGFVLETYIFDFKTGASFKLADTCVITEFSNDDKYILFKEDNFYGAGNEIENNDLAQ